MVATPAPEVADRQGEGVGGIGGPRLGLQLEDAGDHRRHLGLPGASRPGTAALTSVGVQHDREAAAGARQQGDGRGLGRGHHGGHVVRRVDALEGSGVGVEPVEPDVELVLQVGQPLPRVAARRGPDHAHGKHAETTTGSLDHPRPQRVRPGSTPSTPPPLLTSEQVFGRTLHRQGGQPAHQRAGRPSRARDGVLVLVELREDLVAESPLAKTSWTSSSPRAPRPRGSS